MQEQSAPSPSAPLVPAPPVPPTPPALARLAGQTSPAVILRAAEAQREELGNQLEKLSDTRGELSSRLQQQSLDAADRGGLVRQLADVDQRIADVNKQIAEADLRVVQAKGIPGAVVPDRPPMGHDEGPPAGLIVTVVFTIFVLFPLAIAYARRIWRRGAVAPAVIPPELTERLGRLEQAVEAVAVEVERIGEGQRFVTKLFAESPAVRPLAASGGPPEAEPVPAARVRRG